MASRTRLVLLMVICAHLQLVLSAALSTDTAAGITVDWDSFSGASSSTSEVWLSDGTPTSFHSATYTVQGTSEVVEITGSSEFPIWNSGVTSDTASTASSEVSGSSITYACRAYRFALSVGITGTVCVCGFIGNILALVVLTSYDRSGKKSSTPLLLGALAASDILVLITVFMMKSVPSFCTFTDSCGDFLADIFPYFEVYGWPSMDLAHAYSTWIIVVVTVHRYIAVCWPLEAKSICTRTRAIQHLTLAIVMCTLFELPVYLDFHLLVTEDEDGHVILERAYTELGNNHIYQLVYKTTLYYAVMYVIPLIILTIFTTLLIRALNHSKKIKEQMRPQSSNTSLPPSSGKTDDVTRILIVVVLVFMACQPWEPVRRILESIYGFQGCGHAYFYYEEFPSLSFAVNSAANFVIYCLLGSKFRAVLRRKFGCTKNDSVEFDDLTSTSQSAGVPQRLSANSTPTSGQSNLSNRYI